MCLCQKIAVLILGFKQLLRGKKKIHSVFSWTTKLPISKQRHFFWKCLWICPNWLFSFFFGHSFVDHGHATERMSCGIVVGLKSRYTFVFALCTSFNVDFYVLCLKANCWGWNVRLNDVHMLSSIYLAVPFDRLKTWHAWTI